MGKGEKREEEGPLRKKRGEKKVNSLFKTEKGLVGDGRRKGCGGERGLIPGIRGRGRVRTMSEKGQGKKRKRKTNQ